VKAHNSCVVVSGRYTPVVYSVQASVSLPVAGNNYIRDWYTVHAQYIGDIQT